MTCISTGPGAGGESVSLESVSAGATMRQIRVPDRLPVGGITMSAAGANESSEQKRSRHRKTKDCQPRTIRSGLYKVDQCLALRVALINQVEELERLFP